MLKTPIRRVLNDVEPYRPGKPIQELRREKGLKTVVKLASNENPLGPSPKAIRALMRAAPDLHRYPEGTAPELRAALAKRFRLSEEHFVVSNGSDELLHLLTMAFLDPSDNAVASRTGFIRFRQNAGLTGCEIRLAEEERHRHDLEAMADLVDAKTKMIYVASPNNPTGTYSTRAELEALLSRVPERTLVILDEAYEAFAAFDNDYPRTVPDVVERFPNLIVLRTFSKSHGLAGLRVGFAALSPEIASWMHRIRLPFNVNNAAQVAALAALDDDGFVRRSVETVAREARRLRPELLERGFRLEPTGANFFFVETPVGAVELFEALLERGVIVRPLGEYGLDRHVRISIGMPRENDALLKALDGARDQLKW